MNYAINQSRQQRRAAARAARRAGLRVIVASPAFDRAMEDDADFFARNPERSYRVRPTSAAVLDVERAVRRRTALPPAGQRFFTIIHKPNSRMSQRQTAALPADTDCDVGEARACALWDQGAPPGSPASHLALMAAAGLGGSGGGDLDTLVPGTPVEVAP